jgi:AraC-like DNA-binding protein/mannose-6-phosphate isomerase-like protein (cupin superfamily)
MSNNRYIFNNKDANRVNAELLYMTTSKYEGDWSSVLHTHYFTELFYILNGTGKFIVANHAFPVKENDFVIINPNVEHAETSLNSSPLEYVVLAIKDLSFLFGFEDSENSHSVYNYSAYKQEIEFYLQALLNEITKKELNYETVCQNLLEVLITKMVRHTNYSLSIAPSRKINKECGAVKRYIDANYKQNITLDMLAEISHMSKYYLIHLFQNFTGLSPINYMIARRIDESKALLEIADYSISQISEMIGFSSPSYFSQVFKKLVGVSPVDYRKNIKIHQVLSKLKE